MVNYATYTIVSGDDHKASGILAASKDAQGNVQLQQIDMTAGTLAADQSVAVNARATRDDEDEITATPTINLSGADTELSGTIADSTVNASGGKLSAVLSGSTAVTVTGAVEISGDNSHSGDTVIEGEGSKLTAASATALGEGTVILKDKATLDLGGRAIVNTIDVEGCTLSGAAAYNGTMNVSGNLRLTDATTSAHYVTLMGGGNITGTMLKTTIFEALGHGRCSIETGLTIQDNGSINLNDGNSLHIVGNLVLGTGTSITLNGGDYNDGDTLVSWSGSLTGNFSKLVLNGVEETYELVYDAENKVFKVAGGGTPGEDDNSIIGPDSPAAPAFDQATADVLAQGNWGIFTASRAFTDAVRGQRNNMGCIANGRGTAWASLLGGITHISGSGEASGSDITLFGAAVGVDMKLGKRSSLGIAFGYTDGKVSADGMGDIDQETCHIALYGEHELKKFADTSCLSLDWVAATGTTESRYMGAKWKQDSVQLNTRLSWNRQTTERFSYNVFGGLEYFASGADRTMNCKSGSIQNLRGELGMGVRYVALQGIKSVVDEKSGMVGHVPGCERVVLHGEVSYLNDLVRNNPSIEVNGLRGSSANPGRQGIGVEAGATIHLGEKWCTNVNYSFNSMDDSNEHVLNLGASRSF